jgi:hypothetical protein
VAAERATCARARLGLLACTPAVADAMRGLLPPARARAGADACVTAYRLLRGVGALVLLRADLPPPAATTTLHWRGWQSTDLFAARLHRGYIAARIAALEAAAVAAQPYPGWVPLFAPPAAVPAVRPRYVCSAVQRRRLTLLHQAVAAASLGAAAVLLRAGADPLMRPPGEDDDGDGGAHNDSAVRRHHAHLVRGLHQR